MVEPDDERLMKIEDTVVMGDITIQTPSNQANQIYHSWIIGVNIRRAYVWGSRSILSKWGSIYSVRNPSDSDIAEAIKIAFQHYVPKCRLPDRMDVGTVKLNANRDAVLPTDVEIIAEHSTESQLSHSIMIYNSSPARERGMDSKGEINHTTQFDFGAELGKIMFASEKGLFGATFLQDTITEVIKMYPQELVKKWGDACDIDENGTPDLSELVSIPENLLSLFDWEMPSGQSIEATKKLDVSVID